MRIIKKFVKTLILVLVIGGIFLLGADIIRNSDGSLDFASNARNYFKSGIEKAADAVDSTIDNATTEVKRKVAREVTETIAQEVLKNYDGDNAKDVQKVIENISEEDKEKIIDVLAENLSMDSIEDVQTYISNNDLEGLMNYAQDILTEEELSEGSEMVEKYLDGAMDQIEGAAD